MKKILVFGIITLFIAVGIQPVIASVQQIKETKIEDNGEGDLNFGFILVFASYNINYMRPTYPLSGEIVECIDLETGNEVMKEKTGFFGLCLFKFLPMGRDYKLVVSTENGYDSYIVRNLWFFQRAYLEYTVSYK